MCSVVRCWWSAVAAVALPAQASDGEADPGLPFESTHTEEFCGNAARAAGPDQCDVTAIASAQSGAVSAETRLVSPIGGTVPWTALASSTGKVVATYQLAEPVPELNFEIKIRVNEARVALGPGAPGRAGKYDYMLNRSAHVTAAANASHSSCPDWCGGGNSLIVLSAFEPGTTVTTSGENVVVPLRVIRKGGQDIPPGEVTIRTGVGAGVSQTNGWGDDIASVDAVVEKISLSR